VEAKPGRGMVADILFGSGDTFGSLRIAETQRMMLLDVEHGEDAGI
jgi:hypothetical protein